MFPSALLAKRFLRTVFVVPDERHIIPLSPAVVGASRKSPGTLEILATPRADLRVGSNFLPAVAEGLGQMLARSVLVA